MHHDVTVVEQDAARAAAFGAIDCSFVVGDAADPETLRGAGAPRAEALISCTGSDDVNIIAALAGKALGAKKTLAIVSRERYAEAFAAGGALAKLGVMIDRVLWPLEPLAAQMAALSHIPQALASATLLEGKLGVLEFEHHGQVAEKLRRLPEGVICGALLRGKEIILPAAIGDAQQGDKVVLLGRADALARMAERLAPQSERLRICLIGGGEVAQMIAAQLIKRRAQLTIVEANPEVAERLAAAVPAALVLCADGSDPEFLESEDLDTADVLMAVTDNDSTNLLVSLLAQQYGVSRVITRVSSSKNRNIFERVGLDTLITPRQAAVDDVISWLDLDYVESLLILDDALEVIELHLAADFRPRPAASLALPPGTHAVAKLQGESLIFLHPQTEVLGAEHLIVLAAPHKLDALRDWLGAGGRA